MVARIAVYGLYRVRVMAPVRQRFWHRRKDGIRQRYWHKVMKPKWEVRKGRYEFSGRGKELYRAVKIAKHRPPRGYQNTSAREFIENPELFSEEGGVWIQSEVESM